MMWSDSATASFKEVRSGFQLRRRQIFNDCWQLATDADSYNENYARRYGREIQIPFNFEPDIAERRQPAQYMGSLETVGAAT